MGASLLIDPYEAYVEELRERFSTSLVLSIDLPPTGLTAHNKGNSIAKATKVRAYRKLAALASAGQRTETFAGKVRIHHVWFCDKNHFEAAGGANCLKKHKRYRPLDEGNAIQALKPAIDGLVDSGVLSGDTYRHVTWGDYIRLGTKAEHFGRCGILLFLEEIHAR
ncbi:MAG: hypothetical protein JST12_14595 [Armatimonadetes bacterium]|nr:hypothetical protein [Armatimonadota bacterium]